jgi:flagellar motor component MotA
MNPFIIGLMFVAWAIFFGAAILSYLNQSEGWAVVSIIAIVCAIILTLICAATYEQVHNLGHFLNK